jgi:hypothetical protein
MSDSLIDIFAKSAAVHLTILVAATLFFLMAGLRSIKHEEPDAPLFLALAFFFFVIHVFYIANYPDDSPISNPFAGFSIWHWTVVLAAPALVALYLVLGAVHLCFYRFRQGIYDLFFGATLVCYLYIIGGAWPLDVKAILTLVWGLTFFKLELNPAI